MGTYSSSLSQRAQSTKTIKSVGGEHSKSESPASPHTHMSSTLTRSSTSTISAPPRLFQTASSPLRRPRVTIEEGEIIPSSLSPRFGPILKTTSSRSRTTHSRLRCTPLQLHPSSNHSLQSSSSNSPSWPTPRSGHACASLVSGGSATHHPHLVAVIFSGYDGKRRLEDTFVVDTTVLANQILHTVPDSGCIVIFGRSFV